MITIAGNKLTLSVDAETTRYTVTLANGDAWQIAGRPYVSFTDGGIRYLDEAKGVTFAEYRTGIGRGVRASYDLGDGMTLFTRVYMEDGTDDIWFTSRLEGDAPGAVRFVSFPSPVTFDVPEGYGYTVLPRMQGTIVPAGHPIELWLGTMYERDAYMPIFGQVRFHERQTGYGAAAGSGYVMIVDTPFDAHYALRGEEVEPMFKPSLGKMHYERRILYRFMENCDYNDFAAAYRAYLVSTGKLVTLREKCAKLPAVQKLLGCPVVHSGIATHISPKSVYYHPNEPEKNDYFVTFAQRAEELRALKARGLKRAYLHFDGWGKHGYDNLHPDPFPPHEEAGGVKGMRALSDTAKELGYIFGIHDQYRDYYYDAPTYDPEQAVTLADGSHPYNAEWNGGEQSLLCTMLAPDYVKRNYDTFEKLGIRIDAAYLDVFSCAQLDECFHPDHPMTREQCAGARNTCLAHLAGRGIIPSSEEGHDYLIPTMVLCHFSPYLTSSLSSSEAEPVGIPVPWINLVYHDCFIIPWIGTKKSHGGWGIPGTDSGYLHAILNGNPVYCSIYADEETIREAEEACALSETLGYERMIRHEYLDESCRIQRTTFSDGTRITVDFDQRTYRVDRV